jgi:hypothetical protein
MLITEIDLLKCEPRRDFGKGFYVTKFRKQAAFWAVKKGDRKYTDAVITEFEFDEQVYLDKNFNVLRFDSYNDEWFDFVINNRKNFELLHDYDIIEGPVADDKIQQRIDLFLKGKVTREKFFTDLVHDEPNHQICFCTLNSLQMLDFISYEIIFKIEDITGKIVERLIIDFGKSEKEASEIFFASTTFAQLADNSIQLYEKDWTEIYKLMLDELNS